LSTPLIAIPNLFSYTVRAFANGDVQRLLDAFLPNRVKQPEGEHRDDGDAQTPFESLAHGDR
jgi:hypothetical protein